ncbi:conserved hypothetical protein [Thermoplasma acidophilum]|uniref:DUF3834 domain-containing protein n=1 Tax=Thermoplasma acidophilum (strain ATCC 25905 / DSM 1728 / JCM 9062 / NBRC 15155 / AMRC-C165) TaxID=273075 RepID=Q9HL83_THEAC|nr:DUF3834 domain-containing protein [Thermoplasma acidophilum]MCY0852183.1 DUF3834 domain-containing protein [Thermoplasma acidophilum]CAC11491.1 conserved hypothetical protein [Thermoplasma acidophilum]
MEKIRIIAAPGPVSYPIIAARSDIFDIVFDKEQKGDIVLDSTVSLVKRGIKFNLSLIRGLSVISPQIGRKIAVWRRGSANDVLLKIALDLEKMRSDIVYAEDQKEILELLNSGKVDSAVLASPFGSGIRFEDLFRKHDLEMPGSCGAYVREDLIDTFAGEYRKGIEKMRSDPENTSKYVASVLPMKVDPKFIAGTILKSDVSPELVFDATAFAETVKKYLN